MLVLGISGSHSRIHENSQFIDEGSFHDSGAALIEDGRLVAVFEEERLNRIKHTNKLPLLSIRACLRSRGVRLEDVDLISFSQSEGNLKFSLDYLGGGMENTTPREFLADILGKEFPGQIQAAKFEMVEHHYAHAATAFYPSPFDEALVFTIDGSGGEYSGSVYEARQDSMKCRKVFSVGQSLGYLYAEITAYIGFGVFDEYKVMGLAPYGDADAFRSIFDSFYVLLPNGDYEIHKHNLDKLRLIVPPRRRELPLRKEHVDIAAALQQMLERVVFHVATYHREETGLRNLCMAGGVALNCTMNGRLSASGLFDDVFVYPAASDCGLPVGSALTAYFKHAVRPNRFPLTGLFFGNDIGTENRIAGELRAWQDMVSFDKVDDPAEKGAELLAQGKVIGWAQGRSEFAPRALGNRSILADPRPAENKNRINAVVKKREAFRPFAPAVMQEHAGEYFELPADRERSPYMMFVVKVREQHRQTLGAVTHVDGTARVQTVSREDNPRFWQLIRHFKHRTGVPIVVNTSFNNNAEPIVDSATDAIVCFLTTELDNLIIGDFLVTKREFTADALLELYPSVPAYARIEKMESYMWVGGLKANFGYEISNTYDNNKIGISEKMFKALRLADGCRKLRYILAEAGADDHKAAVGEYWELWNKRMIAFYPMPVVQDRKEADAVAIKSFESQEQ